jgi:hypothetical protein
MAQLSITTLIELLVAVLVIGLVIYALLASNGIISPGLKSGLINNQANTESTVNNFDVLLRNLEDCAQLTKDNCVCEGFPSWPSFQKGSTLSIETRGDVTTFVLNFEKKPIGNERLENLKLSGKLIKKGASPNTYVMEDLASDPRIMMDWKTSPPVFSLGGDPGPTFFQKIFGRAQRTAVSGFIYHSQGKMYFLTSFEPEDKVSSYIGSMMKCAS